jgi:kynurenine formamidase
MLRVTLLLLTSLACLAACGRTSPPAHSQATNEAPNLWRIYHDALHNAKYVDLTHAITPSIPVWPGFGHPTFGPSVDPKTKTPYTWAKDGFEATRYLLPTDQLGTQLDPPAHWSPDYPAIDELPPTFAVRPLVVISIVDQVAKAPGYHLSVDDIRRWEGEHGRIPEGAVVFVRSDWSKAWPDTALANRRPFPGVSLAALQFLHLQRHILFHGHEPLDTDTTATLSSRVAWAATRGSSPSVRRTGSTACRWARCRRVRSPAHRSRSAGPQNWACGCGDYSTTVKISRRPPVSSNGANF